MIHYNPGTWSITFAFSVRGSVFPKAIVWALPCSATAVILHTIFQAYPEIFKGVGAGDVGASVLAGFTFILGFLVVFRSQQAYSRWWEGGTLLQQLRGEWFNAFSSLMAFCNQAPEKQQEVLHFQHKLARLCSLLYCTAIQQVSTMQSKNYELIDITEFDIEGMKYMLGSPDRCEVCLQWIQRLIGEANDKQTIKVAPPILSRVYNQLGNGIVNLNNARKITEFPIPFPLAQMITFMLLFHWIITAFVCAASVDKSIWAGILSFIVTMSFWSINYIAVELEQPFGDDPNDLPLHEMQTDMNASLIALLDVRALHPPEFSFKKDHHVLLGKTDCPLEEIFEQKLLAAEEREKAPQVSPESICVDLTAAQVDQEKQEKVKEVCRQPLHLAALPPQPFMTLVNEKLEEVTELGLALDALVAEPPSSCRVSLAERQVTPASRGDSSAWEQGPKNCTTDPPQHQLQQPLQQPLQRQQQLRRENGPDIPRVSVLGSQGQQQLWQMTHEHPKDLPKADTTTPCGGTRLLFGF